MRKLGMIGGMSWVSTAMYYEQINRGISRREGGLASAPLLIESLDFARIAALQSAGEWETLGEELAASGSRLEAAGAQGLIIASNTMHKVYGRIGAEIGIPMLHVGDVVAETLVKDGVKKAGLIGTRFTMAEPFYRERIEGYGITIALPDDAMRQEMDRIIFEELTRDIVLPASQRTMETCLTTFAKAGCQAVILGCTELIMLADPETSVLPVYDTTALHSRAAVDWILDRAEPAAAS